MQIKDEITKLANQQQFFTVTWKRMEENTLVTVNGIVMYSDNRNAYIWQNKEGRDRFILRGIIVSDRTEERSLPNKPNLSDAGADGKWKYWTAPLENITEIRYKGKVLSVC